MTDKRESFPLTPETPALKPSSHWSPFLFSFQFSALKHSIYSLFPSLRVRISPSLNAKSIIDWTQPLPLLSPATWYGCQLVDGSGSGSALKTRLINLPPGRVTEHTNVGPAENPLAILINTHMRERVQWNAGVEALVIARMCKHAQNGDKMFKGPLKTHNVFRYQLDLISFVNKRRGLLN